MSRLDPQAAKEPFQHAERIILMELARFWDLYNWQYLNKALQRPGFELSTGTSTLGSWDHAKRLIRISAEHVRCHAWLGVMETLRHEMAHQYVDEVLGGADPSPHGPAFRRACHLLRVSPSASGTGEEATLDAAGESPAGDAIRSKIAKLLSLAGSPNEHEAQLAMLKARQLLLKYNLSAMDLEGNGQRYGWRSLGCCKKRWQRHDYTRAAILQDFFFVQTLWVGTFDVEQLRRGSQLVVFGTTVNLDMAEYVYGFVEGLLPNLWSAYKRRTHLESDRGRLHFYWGVMQGFREKLLRQGAELEETEALVWMKDPGLQTYYRHLYPRTTTTQRSPIRVHDTYADGVRQGRHVTLHKPVSAASRTGGNLLPPAS